MIVWNDFSLLNKKVCCFRSRVLFCCFYSDNRIRLKKKKKIRGRNHLPPTLFFVSFLLLIISCNTISTITITVTIIQKKKKSPIFVVSTFLLFPSSSFPFHHTTLCLLLDSLNNYKNSYHQRRISQLFIIHLLHL